MGYKKLSNDQELQLIEEYKKGAPVKELMLKYGYKTKKSITDKIKKHYPNQYSEIIKQGHTNRRGYEYSLEEITSPFDAYFVGLLMTDGYVLSDRNGVGIDMTDEDVIAFIAKTIGVNYKKYFKEERKDIFRVLVNTPKIVEQVKRFGIVRKKSLTLSPPLLSSNEERYLPYLIRGIIDGDGCVSRTSYGGAQFYIVTMSDKFANWLVEILENRFFMTDIHKTQNEYGMWKVETSNQYNILKLIAVVYNHPFGMKRKYSELRRTFRDYNSDTLLDKDDGIVQTTTFF